MYWQAERLLAFEEDLSSTKVWIYSNIYLYILYYHLNVTGRYFTQTILLSFDIILILSLLDVVLQTASLRRVEWEEYRELWNLERCGLY